MKIIYAKSKKDGIKEVLVDDEDYERLNHSKWYIYLSHNVFYAVRGLYKDGVRTAIVIMHRVIMDAKKGEIIDHKDGNGLNNQKDNLRKCTNAQNIQNSRAQTNRTSKYKGVYLQTNTVKWFRIRTNDYKEKSYPVWVASVRIKGKIKQIGRFKTEEEAAMAYDKAAKLYYGEFANINFK